ncbi:response regulator transcription factor [Xinfangfangia sp. CPCC 101601]|uniref:Response regulator transcription factor n=1 Tax=Pseudogemmobacter lacusdianii TaxID=3069608 RepID=A0ABU0VWL0_9RHOB|nr:response regulator transcription factor [Xinfangfangia sp. CPCC 101601]MDQ2066142.1 response regulator transcription factor [Xinfangfangia sp. CPCC 101601]
MSAAEKATGQGPLILVVEDDADQALLLADMLQAEGYRSATCADARGLMQLLAEELPALVLLDLGLPDEDGFALAAKIRALHGVPIIILTGRGSEVDRVVGLEIGADDYLVKPFSLRELAARIRAVLRRSTAAPAPPLGEPSLRDGFRFEGWSLDSARRKLSDPSGRPVELTVGEFDLLAALLAAHGRILSRAQLLDLTRRSHDAVYERTIDVLILRLRRKIEPDPSQPRLIVTERAIGYLFAGAVEIINGGEVSRS